MVTSIDRYDEVDVFVGLDVGKGEHHAVALDRVGANLNQIARHLNSGERAHDHEVIAVLDQTRRALRDARFYLGRDPEKMLRWLGLHELMIESEAA